VPTLATRRKGFALPDLLPSVAGQTLLAALLVAAALAGCASKAPGAPGAAAVSALGVQATATTGVVRGLVVDEAIRPIAGATVRETPGNHTAKTNAAGAFGFSGLAPGIHFLTASKTGYASVQQSTDVAAGVSDPLPVRIQLSALPSSKPYHDLVKFRGHEILGATALTPDNPVTGPRTDFALSSPLLFNGSFDVTYAFPVVPTWEQVVVVWDAKTPAAARLQVSHCVYVSAGNCDEKGTRYANATEGTSPIVASADARLESAFVGNGSLTDYVLVLPTGTTGVAPADAGMTFDQDFTVITVHTYNYAPPAGYRFDKDGEPVDPA
jgi:hypothetical protein